MCGRYTLATEVEKLVEEFDLSGAVPDLSPSYNVAPTQDIATILGDGEERRLALMRWGLIPSWADDPQIGSRMINARSETAAEKPSFRAAFKKRRCLIPADGFYEWQKTNGAKQPFHIRKKGGRTFAFAGLWESWREDDGPEIRSCTILTTEANDLLTPIHGRMPVILDPENYDFWLDPDIEDAEPLGQLLRPYPPEGMEAYPVSRHVNKPSNNDPRCVEPAA
ncbi:MAG: SOS response-associated peptidase [Rubrobacteraceae bacterium]